MASLISLKEISSLDRLVIGSDRHKLYHTRPVKTSLLQLSQYTHVVQNYFYHDHGNFVFILKHSSSIYFM